MKIVCISDTHEQEDKVILPEGDLLIHSGDWTYKGSFAAIEKFLEWFSKQPHKYKVFCAGNHELTLDYGPQRKPKLKLIYSYCNDKMHYLEDENVVIEDHLIHASPVSPFFYNWAWNRSRGSDIKKHWDMIDEKTTILITHGPPAFIGDLTERGEHIGCQDLLNRILELKQLKCHIFGHHHGGYGLYYKYDKIFINAAICNEKYQPINKPIVMDI